ncbi:MAG TPA: serine/threonine-protein kinase [Planctomycetota bacterium]|nr:serine/threonine-protein kinase [Planctomycetota bacterium]
MRIGAYLVEGELGRGGMGRVYKARHEGTGVVRAIKVLDHQGDLESVLRFRREAEALARAGGAVSVPIHESGVEQGRFFFVMDFMPGGSLADLLKRRGTLPWREAAALMARVARSLEKLHELGLIHRDLKPANVLLGDDGAPRIADLGCVRDLSRSALTETGTIIGTPAYMAPEQLLGEPVGPAADVFAAGVILHELVLGSRPHVGSTPVEIFASVSSGDRTPLEPPALEAIVARALDREPSRRPTAVELARDLESLASGGVTRRRRSRALPVALVLLLAALGVAALAFSSGKTKPAAAPLTRDELLARARALASATSATTDKLSLRDLARVASADPLTAEILVRKTPYSFDEVALARAETRGWPVLDFLWAKAALETGDGSLREKAREALRGAPRTLAEPLLRALEDGNDLAAAVALENLELAIDPALSDEDQRIVKKAPLLVRHIIPQSTTPSMLRSILAPVPWRSVAFEGSRRRSTDRYPDSREGPRELIIKGALSAIGPERLPAEALAVLALVKEELVEHKSPTSEDLRRRLEAAAQELAARDPLFSLLARERALKLALQLERWRGDDDEKIESDARAALALVESLAPTTDDERLWARLLRHDVARIRLAYLVDASTRADEATRAELLARGASLKDTLCEPPWPGAVRYDKQRSYEAQLLVLATTRIFEREDPTTIDEELVKDLSSRDWVRLECLRILHKPEALDAALDLLRKESLDPNELRQCHMIAALAAIDQRNWAVAQEQIDWLTEHHARRLAPGRYSLDFVRHRLEERRG